MMNLSALKVDKEFQGKIPPLNTEEEQLLEQNMIKDGRLLNPIIIWQGYILDGHTRYRILKRHPEISFEVKEIQLTDRYAALAWICQNQLGRRNLDPERRKFLMGKAYENEKLSVGGSLSREHDERGRFTSRVQNEHNGNAQRTCEKLAKKNGVSPSFIRRAEQYAKGVDAAENAVPGAMEEILTGHLKATNAEITALAKTPKEKIPVIIEELRKPKKERQTRKDQAAPMPETPDEVHTGGDAKSENSPLPEVSKRIQGHKRCLTAQDRRALQASIDNRNYRETVSKGSLMMCEVQGAKEDFIRRWEITFRDYPDIFEDTDCRRSILSLIEDAIIYLQRIKENVL